MTPSGLSSEDGFQVKSVSGCRGTRSLTVRTTENGKILEQAISSPAAPLRITASPLAVMSPTSALSPSAQVSAFQTFKRGFSVEARDILKSYKSSGVVEVTVFGTYSATMSANARAVPKGIAREGGHDCSQHGGAKSPQRSPHRSLNSPGSPLQSMVSAHGSLL